MPHFKPRCRQCPLSLTRDRCPTCRGTSQTWLPNPPSAPLLPSWALQKGAKNISSVSGLLPSSFFPLISMEEVVLTLLIIYFMFPKEDGSPVLRSCHLTFARAVPSARVTLPLFFTDVPPALQHAARPCVPLCGLAWLGLPRLHLARCWCFRFLPARGSQLHLSVSSSQTGAIGRAHVLSLSEFSAATTVQSEGRRRHPPVSAPLSPEDQP